VHEVPSVGLPGAPSVNSSRGNHTKRRDGEKPRLSWAWPLHLIGAAREKDAVNYSSLHIFKTSATILDFNKVFDNYLV
jgi:hypothetical protein